MFDMQAGQLDFSWQFIPRSGDFYILHLLSFLLNIQFTIQLPLLGFMIETADKMMVSRFY